MRLQFGMLIEFLFETVPNWEDGNGIAIGDLQVSGNYKIMWILVGSCLIPSCCLIPATLSFT
jgi:hypothetical protein